MSKDIYSDSSGKNLRRSIVVDWEFLQFLEREQSDDIYPRRFGSNMGAAYLLSDKLILIRL